MSAGRPGGRATARPGRRADRSPAVTTVTAARRLSLFVIVTLLALAPVLHHHGLGGASAYLVVGLLLGLPHGAVDHVVPVWLAARGASRALRLAVPLGYAAVAGIALAAFRAVPAPALAAFLALSIAHFGAADGALHDERAGEPVRYRIDEVLARGGPPVLVPLLLWPGTVDPLLAAVAPGLPGLLSGEVRTVAAIALLAAVVATALREFRAGSPVVAAEPLLLVGFFAAVPPPLAIGAYFAAWHSTRHVARLLHSDPGNHADLTAGRLGRPLGRFARRAALPTLAATAVLAALLGRPGHPVDPLPTTVAVLAALTVPHAALVAWMDRRSRPLSGA